jgi:hypothetical protein
MDVEAVEEVDDFESDNEATTTPQCPEDIEIQVILNGSMERQFLEKMRRLERERMIDALESYYRYSKTMSSHEIAMQQLRPNHPTQLSQMIAFRNAQMTHENLETMLTSEIKPLHDAMVREQMEMQRIKQNIRPAPLSLRPSPPRPSPPRWSRYDSIRADQETRTKLDADTMNALQHRMEVLRNNDASNEHDNMELQACAKRFQQLRVEHQNNSAVWNDY